VFILAEDEGCNVLPLPGNDSAEDLNTDSMKGSDFCQR
jgi:hypothetical protein